MKYEGMIYRPPSEAYSLILQVTVGCSHTKCTFCGSFKDKKFRVKSFEEIREDVEEARAYEQYVKKVFLADGDALIIPQKRLLPIVELVKNAFPRLERIGVYGNAKSILKKSVEELKALKEMGKTILISSHLLHELAQVCTRIGIIEAGRMVTQGSVAEIYRQLGVLKIVHVQVANQTPELIMRLKGLAGITQVDEQVDRISIRFQEGSIEVEDIHDFIHEQGARIRMFQPEVMDMETAFMKLTEGQTA